MNEIRKEMKLLTDIVIGYINGMSNKEVSYSNINFLFKRNPLLKTFAIGCINTVEDKGIDSRGLSIGFSNTFSDHERCLDDERILDDGKYIIDVPSIVIQRGMLWLTEQVLTDSSFGTKVKKWIPPAALQSNSAFDEFITKEGTGHKK